MSRYIDADAYAAELWKLRQNYQMLDDTHTADKIMHGIFRAEQTLKEMPTVDAVPIDFLKQFAEGKRGYYSDFVIEAVKSYRVKTMRLIDANAIKLEKGFFERVDNVPKFYEWLGKQPIIDAVPVVRCRGCKKWNRYKDGIKGLCGHSDHVMPTREDFYCADGERRSDD